jgi:hypothetical protein
MADVSNQPQSRVPHLRDSLIVAKVGHFRGSENPATQNSPIRPVAQTMSKSRSHCIFVFAFVVACSVIGFCRHPE